MNNTNRGLNRLFILLVGVILLAAGGVALALTALPQVTSQWRSVGAQLARGAQPWVAQPVVGRASLLVIGIVVVCLVLIILLLTFVLRQGHGHSAAAIERRDGTTSVRIDLAVPRALLEEHLGGRSELTGVRISAYEVRGTPMLKVTARCERGVSPAVVAELIGAAIDDLERIIGTDVPAFVQLTGGFRVRSTTRPRVA